MSFHDNEQGDHAERQGDLSQPQGISDGDTQQSNGTYQYHNGRPYHDRKDVAYVFPADDEENDRIHMQHWLIKGLSGSNYGAPVTNALVKGIKVHDAGCGPGTWSLEMANDYPNSTLYGTDILTRFPETIKPGNCHFKSLNLSAPGNFPENYFGYIHQRLLIGALPTQSWEAVIEEHVRTLAPGGWLEAVEPNFFHCIERAPPKLSLLLTACTTVFALKGLNPRIDDDLEEIFKRAGLVNVHVVIFDFPMGETTQLGNLAWEDTYEAFRSLVPHAANEYPQFQTEESRDQFQEETRKECLEHRPLLPFARVCGQKRLAEMS